MANVWGYWKCPACGGLVRGDKRNCPGCEMPIPAGVKYMPPNHPEVVKAFEKNGGSALEYVPVEKERERPNWICQYCGAQNFDEVQNCAGCGMPRFGAKEDYFGHQIGLTEEEKKQRELSGMAPSEATDESSAKEGQPDGSDAKEGQLDGGDAKEGQSDGSDTKEGRLDDGTEYVESVNEKGQRVIQIKAGDADGSNSVQLILPPAEKPKTKKNGAWKLFLLLLAILWCIFPVKQKMTVNGFEWQREIAVEEYQLCHESDWKLPDGAKLTNKKSEIHHYDHVLDHYETRTRRVAHKVQDGYDVSYRDLGNGQYKEVRTPRYRTEYTTETYKEPVYRDVPVYRTKYYYDIGRWKEVSPLVARGTSKETYWPQTDLPTRVDNPAYGNRRQGNRKETYWVLLESKKGKTIKQVYPVEEWVGLNAGDTVSKRRMRFLTWFS